MKTFSILFLFLLACTGTATAQSAIIGTGTENTNGNIADPTERYYQYERFQIVFTAAELTAAGMPAGAEINAMGFSITQSAVSLANYTIDLGHTTQPLADPYIPGGLTTVRSAFTYTPVVQAEGNFDMIQFSTPFAWDGVSNLLVNTCTGPNPFIIPYGGLRYTVAALGSVRYIRNDGANYCAVTTVENSTFRPNIRFDYIPGTGGCLGTPTPGNTISSANPVCSGFPFILSLQFSTFGTGVSYQWQYSYDGEEPWTNTGISSPEFETSQTTSTWYRCVVSCGSLSDESTPVLVEMNANALEYFYVGGIDDAPACYGATNAIFVAGEGDTYEVLPGGEAILVAGMSIFILDGTTVQPGGYLLAYIDPCGPYCGSPASKPTAATNQQRNPLQHRQPQFSIQPNPTSGDFILEFKGETPPSDIIVEMTGITGEQVLQRTRMTATRQTFSLSHVPAGIYFVRVVTAEGSETVKVVRY